MRTLHKLTNRTIETRNTPGKYSDGGGLYLVVSKRGSKNWCFMYRWGDKRPELGMGGYPTVSLAEARARAVIARKALNNIPKQDPRDVFKSLKQTSDEPITLGAFTERLLDRILVDFKNAKHRQQWRNSLKTYAAPINNRSIAEIETKDVLGVLSPIWNKKRETARRVQGRLERIFDAAKAEGLRSGENPARWKGHLDTTLPNNRPNRKHHAALRYELLPAFISTLRERHSLSAQCLEFIVLTATRSSEARNATWDEIDLNKAVWTIRRERMKMRRQHRIPLSDRAIDILRDLAGTRVGDFVFPGQSLTKGISETSIRKLLLGLSDGALTTHGFRSTFRDWVFEQTEFPREVAEISLSHNVGDATERAYRRGDALEKRRVLMQAWTDYSEKEVCSFEVGHGR